ncbi:hypothetical protein FRC03_004073 [Tulasnella sp. 419]|nr:hypothetical protein FRC02_007420 [Tulasnella sp. 418]KAG8970691.1 hypothetical protein FRC03_004073 [Tulasnella sp. 419]
MYGQRSIGSALSDHHGKNHPEKRWVGALVKVGAKFLARPALKVVAKIGLKASKPMIKAGAKSAKPIIKYDFMGLKRIAAPLGVVLDIISVVSLLGSLATLTKDSKTNPQQVEHGLTFEECKMKVTGTGGLYTQASLDKIASQLEQGMTDLEKYLLREQLCASEGLNAHEVDFLSKHLNSAPEVEPKGGFSERQVQAYVESCPKLEPAQQQEFLKGIKELKDAGANISDEVLNRLSKACAGANNKRRELWDLN